MNVRKLLWVWLSLTARIAVILGGTASVGHLAFFASDLWFEVNSAEASIQVVRVEEKVHEKRGLFRPVLAVIDADGTQTEFTERSFR